MSPHPEPEPSDTVLLCPKCGDTLEEMDDGNLHCNNCGWLEGEGDDE